MSNYTAENVKAFLLKKYAEALTNRQLNHGQVPDTFDLLAEGIIDSLGVLNMISDVEREFKIQLDMEHLDAEQLTIIGPFCRYVAVNGKPLNQPDL